MSIPKIYLPNPVEIYNFFTQPNEKYCITKIIWEKSKHSSDENTDVIGMHSAWIMKYINIHFYFIEYIMVILP